MERPGARRIRYGGGRRTVGPWDAEIRGEVDYFGYCVLTGTTPESDGPDGVADLRTIDAVYESAGSGGEVVLE